LQAQADTARRESERIDRDRRRQVRQETKASDEAARQKGSWWLMPKSRDEFSQAAGARARELQTDKAAARVKTKFNFVE